MVGIFEKIQRERKKKPKRNMEKIVKVQQPNQNDGAKRRIDGE